MVFSDAAIYAIIGAIPTTIASISTLIVAIRSNTRIEEVKKATDGIKDELVRTTREQALLEGRETGRAEGVEVGKEQGKEIAAGRLEGVEVGKEQGKDIAAALKDVP